jgi:hypothetical protein
VDGRVAERADQHADDDAGDQTENDRNSLRHEKSRCLRGRARRIARTAGAGKYRFPEVPAVRVVPAF